MPWLSRQTQQKGEAAMTLALCTITDAKRFIAQYHRHNRPPVSALFALALEHDGEVVGVATVGRPVARMLQDGRTVEVTRTCTKPGAPKGAVSKLYSLCARAAFALGWQRCVTYTLQSESGASLRGAGWQMELELPATAGWTRPSRAAGRDLKPLLKDILPPDATDGVAKRRWVKEAV